MNRVSCPSALGLMDNAQDIVLIRDFRKCEKYLTLPFSGGFAVIVPVAFLEKTGKIVKPAVKRVFSRRKAGKPALGSSFYARKIGKPAELLTFSRGKTAFLSEVFSFHRGKTGYPAEVFSFSRRETEILLEVSPFCGNSV